MPQLHVARVSSQLQFNLNRVRSRRAGPPRRLASHPPHLPTHHAPLRCAAQPLPQIGVGEKTVFDAWHKDAFDYFNNSGMVGGCSRGMVGAVGAQRVAGPGLPTPTYHRRSQCVPLNTRTSQKKPTESRRLLDHPLQDLKYIFNHMVSMGQRYNAVSSTAHQPH